MGDGATMKHCSNCLRDIAEENFVMHEVHCRRNIALCTHCREPVPRAEMDDHYEEYHASTECGKCKKSMEKTEIEAHKDECPKRIIPCQYCELELVFDEMSAHTDYCGTRTEMCVKCSQYIMHKDLEKHEQSGCKYPTPKPNNSTETRRQHLHPFALRGFDMDSGSSGGSSNGGSSAPNGFAMDEISRLMRMSALNSNASRPNVTRNHFDARGLKRTNEITRGSQGGGGGARGGRGRDVNDIRTYEDDELLAQYLAQDLGQEEPSVRQWVIEDPLQPDDGTEDTLPCEFCTELIPLSSLIQHQSGCQATLNEAFHSPPSSRRGGQKKLNNTERTARPPPSPPRWLDNLGSSANECSGIPNSDHSTSDDDDIMLPCEFCHELFPSVALFTHQAECDLNVTQTPRTMTPAQPSRPARTGATWTVPHTSPTQPRRVKHQANPTFDTAGPSRGQGQGQSRGQGRVNNGSSIHGSKGTKKKNTDRRDESYEQFPTHSDWTAGGSGDSVEETPTDSRASSAAHVRATLDSLIQAPDVNLDKRHKMQDNTNVKAKAGTGGQAPGPSTRKYPAQPRTWTLDNDPPPPYDPSFGRGGRGKRPVGSTRQDVGSTPAGRNNDLRSRNKKTPNTTRGGRGGGTRGRRPPQGDV